MLAVPATIACAEVGDLDAAHRYLVVAENSSARWPDTAWAAAVLEAQAHVARSEGRLDESAEKFAAAAISYGLAGQPLDAARCQRSLTDSLATAGKRPVGSL